MANGNARVVLACVLAASVVNAIRWKSCDTTTPPLGTPTAVMVSGCETADTCILQKGHNESFKISFTSNEDTPTLTSVVYGHILGQDVPFAIDNPDACKDSGIQCPIKSGTSYNYENQIYIKEIYPPMKLSVKWKLQDGNKKDVICITLPVEIKSSSNSVNRQSKVNQVVRFLQRRP